MSFIFWVAAANYSSRGFFSATYSSRDFLSAVKAAFSMVNCLISRTNTSFFLSSSVLSFSSSSSLFYNCCFSVIIWSTWDLSVTTCFDSSSWSYSFLTLVWRSCWSWPCILRTCSSRCLTWVLASLLVSCSDFCSYRFNCSYSIFCCSRALFPSCFYVSILSFS